MRLLKFFLLPDGQQKQQVEQSSDRCKEEEKREIRNHRSDYKKHERSEIDAYLPKNNILRHVGVPGSFVAEGIKRNIYHSACCTREKMNRKNVAGRCSKSTKDIQCTHSNGSGKKNPSFMFVGIMSYEVGNDDE